VLRTSALRCPPYPSHLKFELIYTAALFRTKHTHLKQVGCLMIDNKMEANNCSPPFYYEKFPKTIYLEITMRSAVLKIPSSSSTTK